MLRPVCIRRVIGAVSGVLDGKRHAPHMRHESHCRGEGRQRVVPVNRTCGRGVEARQSVRVVAVAQLPR